MPTIVIKPSRDEDFYVGWSTIVEAPVWCGSRDEAAQILIRDASGSSMDQPESRLARADLNGTSAAGHFAWFGRWDYEAFIYEQRGRLLRERLAEAVRLLEASNESGVWDLLMPFEDETEVRRG